MKTSLTGLIILRLQAMGQIKSFSTRDENQPVQSSPLAESEPLSMCPSQTHPTIQSECLLMKSGSNYLYKPPSTKGSSQEQRDEISAYLS